MVVLCTFSTLGKGEGEKVLESDPVATIKYGTDVNWRSQGKKRNHGQ